LPLKRAKKLDEEGLKRYCVLSWLNKSEEKCKLIGGKIMGLWS